MRINPSSEDILPTFEKINRENKRRKTEVFSSLNNSRKMVTLLPIYDTVSKCLPDLVLKHQTDRSKMEYEFNAESNKKKRINIPKDHYPIHYIESDDIKKFDSIQLSIQIKSSYPTCYISMVANDMDLNDIPWIINEHYHVNNIQDSSLMENEVLNQISYRIHLRYWQRKLPMMLRIKFSREYEDHSIESRMKSTAIRVRKRCQYQLIYSHHTFQFQTSREIQVSTAYKNIFKDKMSWIKLMKIDLIYTKKTKITKTYKQPPLLETVNNYFPLLNLKQQDGTKMEYEFSANTLKERKVLGSKTYLPIQVISLEDTQEYKSIKISMMIVASHSSCSIQLLANDMSFNPIPWIKDNDYEITSESYLSLKEDEVLKLISYQLQFDDWKKELPMMIRFKFLLNHDVKGLNTVGNYKRKRKRCKYELIHSQHIFDERLSLNKDDLKYKNRIPWIHLMKVYKIYQSNMNLPTEFGYIANYQEIQNIKASFFLFHQDNQSSIFGLNVANDILTRSFTNSKYSIYPWEFLLKKKDNTFNSTQVFLIIASNHKNCNVQLIAFEDEVEIYHLDDEKWKEGMDYTIEDFTESSKATSYQHLLNENANTLFQVNYKLNYKSMKLDKVTEKKKSYIGIKLKKHKNLVRFRNKKNTCKYFLVEGSQSFQSNSISSSFELKQQYPWIMF